MRLFLDTSALAKRYVAERNSERVAALCAEADDLVVSVLCFPELVSTLSRLVRERRLSREDYRRLKAALEADLADVEECQLTGEVVAAAVRLLEMHPLRAMDAIHLASALEVGPDLFASADRRQLAAARTAGVRVVDVA